jgi:hypothetical protein
MSDSFQSQLEPLLLVADFFDGLKNGYSTFFHIVYLATGDAFFLPEGDYSFDTFP